MSDPTELVDAEARARMDPDMAEAFGHELKVDAYRPLPTDLAEERRRGIEAAPFWNEGLPKLAAVEDHEIAGMGGPIPVRLFRPRLDRPAPVLLYAHGGGWVMGSVLQNEPAIRTLAHESGWTVAALSYRLAPEHPFPAGLDDCRAVARWLRQDGHNHGLDPDRIAVGGASAGGNLALATALAERDSEDGVRFAALILFYGVFGADLTTESYREFGDGRFGLSTERMAHFLDWYDPENRRHRDPLIQPLLADLEGLPPTFLLAAGLDVLRDETLALARKMEAAGVKTELHVEKGALHGFINRGRLVEATRRSLRAAGEFLGHE